MCSDKHLFEDIACNTIPKHKHVQGIYEALIKNAFSIEYVTWK